MTLDEFAKQVDFDYEEFRKERDGSVLYKATLEYKGRKLITDFYQGAALEEDGMEPDVVRVLHALQLECDNGRMAFEHFCQHHDLPVENQHRPHWIKARDLHERCRELFRDDFDLFLDTEEEVA